MINTSEGFISRAVSSQGMMGGEVGEVDVGGDVTVEPGVFVDCVVKTEDVPSMGV
jgi:hypothetical protein